MMLKCDVMKLNTIVLSLFLFSFCACFDDKGNYDYREVAEITIENIPEVIEVLGSSEHIIVKPKVVSSLEGEIVEDNVNFKFDYKIGVKEVVIKSGQKWINLNPIGTLNLDTLATFAADTYTGCFIVTDNVLEYRRRKCLILGYLLQLMRGGWYFVTKVNRNG